MIVFAMVMAGLVGVVLGRHIAWMESRSKKIDRSNAQDHAIAVLRGKLARIEAIEGCECDSYEGHICELCRIRALAAYDETMED